MVVSVVVRRYLQFALRVVHSLSGVAFSLFLCEHLFTNMLASSYFKQGQWFIAMVNQFHRVPGLVFVEICCLAAPFLLHTCIGIYYLFCAECNSGTTDGSKPALHYARNLAYTWQRRTAWFLLLGLIVHVVQFRFVHYPLHVEVQGQHYYAVAFQPERFSILTRGQSEGLVINFSSDLFPSIALQDVTGKDASRLVAAKSYILAPKAGIAFLYAVRDSLGSLWTAIFYSLFVLFAAFHGFNGLWTCCSRWGIFCSHRYLTWLRILCYCAAVVVASMGISVIWNLYYGSVQAITS